MASEMKQPEELYSWFYYKTCPLQGDCSPENWKKWKVWGDTELDAQQQLYRHLTQSGNHNCSPEEADELIAKNAGLWQAFLPEPRKSKSQAIGAATAAVEDVPPSKRLKIPGDPRSSSSSSSSRAVANQGSMPPQNEPTVTLRMQQFNTIIDSVQRSSQAAKQAARIAGVASAAFVRESDTLDEIAVMMQGMKSAAEFAATPTAPSSSR
jgi:hypothetical protein